MERGPLALFGAIVAVGLGPALWLGVQFGGVQVFSDRPPVVSEQRPGGQELLGGRGAAADPTVDKPVIGSTPQGNVLPATSSPPASPSASPSASRSGSSGPSRSPSAGPSTSVDPSASPSGSPTTPSTSDDDQPGESTRPSDPATTAPVASVSSDPSGGTGAGSSY